MQDANNIQPGPPIQTYYQGRRQTFAAPMTPTQNTVGTKVPTLNNPKSLQQNHPLHTKRTPTPKKKQTSPQNKKVLPFVIPYDPYEPNITCLLHKNWHLIENDPILSQTFPEKNNHSFHPTNQRATYTTVQPRRTRETSGTRIGDTSHIQAISKRKQQGIRRTQERI